jgi:fumarate reductase flavoprotein subunit
VNAPASASTAPTGSVRIRCPNCCVFGKVAGEEAARFAKGGGAGNSATCSSRRRRSSNASLGLKTKTGGSERIATLRKEMAQTMEDGCGIYRLAETMQADLRQARRTQGALQERQCRGQVERLEHRVAAGHRTRVPARRGADDGHSALHRRESRGAHQRLDGFEQRDDVNFLKHSQAHYVADGAPRIDYGAVKITKSQPGTRAYGAAGEKAEQERKASHV